MQRELKLKNGAIKYTLKRSKRAKRISLTVGCDAKVSVTIPWRASENLAGSFIQKKINWLLKKIYYFENEGRSLVPGAKRKDYLEYKALARDVVRKKIDHFNLFYKALFGKITIRCQKTRWGSCSRKGNLSFNYRIIFLSEKLSDYVVVHELCHLLEFNHSSKFWELVAKTIPDYKEIRKKVRRM